MDLASRDRHREAAAPAVHSRTTHRVSNSLPSLQVYSFSQTRGTGRYHLHPHRRLRSHQMSPPASLLLLRSRQPQTRLPSRLCQCGRHGAQAQRCRSGGYAAASSSHGGLRSLPIVLSCLVLSCLVSNPFPNLDVIDQVLEWEDILCMNRPRF